MDQKTQYLLEKVRYLMDRTEIVETVVRYFNALDSKDWVEMRATLAHDIDLDFSQLFGNPRETLNSDDFVEFARDILSGFEATQHISPNHVVAIDGDQATCKAYMYAWHTVPTEPGEGDTFTLRGHYACGMIRTPDGWRMNKLHMLVYHEAGNKRIYEVARRRYAGVEALPPESS